MTDMLTQTMPCGVQLLHREDLNPQGGDVDYYLVVAAFDYDHGELQGALVKYCGDSYADVDAAMAGVLIDGDLYYRVWATQAIRQPQGPNTPISLDWINESSEVVGSMRDEFADNVRQAEEAWDLMSRSRPIEDVVTDL